jgi:hypothetical protein
MSDENKEVFLNQEFFIAEYVDDENYFVKVKFRKVERWAFYLRFVSEWFFPCTKDQIKLKDLFFNTELRLSIDSTTVTFAQVVKRNKIQYRFVMPFISTLPFYEFIPCPECQKQLARILQKSTILTIGNKDYEHPVELNRKNEDDDQSFETISKRKATKEEIDRDTGWHKKQIPKEEYQKLAVIEE